MAPGGLDQLIRRHIRTVIDFGHGVCGDFSVRCIITFTAIDNLRFTGFRQNHKFMAVVTSDSSGIRLYNPVIQAAAAEHVAISLVHGLVAFFQPFGIPSKEYRSFIINSRPRIKPKRGRRSSRNLS